MTIDELLNLVPWGEMEINRRGMIRHRESGECPICAVWGGLNIEAVDVAKEHGMDEDDAYFLTGSADGPSHQGYDHALRAEMERRIVEAQHG